MTIIARETLLANATLMSVPNASATTSASGLKRPGTSRMPTLKRRRRPRPLQRRRSTRILERFDLLVTPALPLAPPLLPEANEPAKVLTLTHYLRPFNLSGHPAIVLPAETSDGLPSVRHSAGRGKGRGCAADRHGAPAHRHQFDFPDGGIRR